MVRLALTSGVRLLVRVFPKTARRVAEFSLRELGQERKASAANKSALSQKVERQARQIELQKARLRERDHRLSASKDKVGF